MRQEEFRQLNTRIVIISFSTLPPVQEWINDVCRTFITLLDKERAVYKAYQLERSRLRSWHPRVIWVYFKRWIQRGEFFDSHGDDTSQLGGDFIVDKNGILQFIHPSYDPTDRPSVDELIKAIKSIQ